MIATSLQEFYESLTPNSPIIGIDHGAKKLGIAITDPARIMALPLEVASIEKEAAKLEYIKQLVLKHKAGGIVLGLPTYMDGTVSSQTHAVNNFAKKLAVLVYIPIFFQDERLSTAAAQSLLRDSGMKRKQRDLIDDKISASLILEAVVEELKKIALR